MCVNQLNAAIWGAYRDSVAVFVEGGGEFFVFVEEFDVFSDFFDKFDCAVVVGECEVVYHPVE